MIDTPLVIPEDLKQRTAGHGYAFGCECDLVGGDSECKIQPPYESQGEYIDRLLELVVHLRQQNKTLRKALALCHQSHTYCEDSWYSCPKAEGGCADDNAGPDCACGADVHNARIDAALKATEGK